MCCFFFLENARALFFFNDRAKSILNHRAAAARGFVLLSPEIEFFSRSIRLPIFLSNYGFSSPSYIVYTDAFFLGSSSHNCYMEWNSQFNWTQSIYIYRKKKYTNYTTPWGPINLLLKNEFLYIMIRVTFCYTYNLYSSSHNWNSILSTQRLNRNPWICVYNRPKHCLYYKATDPIHFPWHFIEFFFN